MIDVRSFVSLAALGTALAASPAWAQPATVPTPPSGQPGTPSSQATTPLPGTPAAADAQPGTATTIDGATVPTESTAANGGTGASGDFLNAIVVTGSRQGRTKMQSSTSVTDLTPAQITQFTPRSEADILHLIPGIRSESTAGPAGNSNITVRGLPLASGGSKYVQLQENGLPDVEFGDIAFGNNDFWLRYDYTVDRIQTVRGGTASTGASQAPGAVINYVSKTGETAGGRIGLSVGTNYNEQRVDFTYGAPINETLRFNIGGFYRRGDGPRDLSYLGENGYQIKGNVTKTFHGGDGYVRLNFKRLDDRSPSYTSVPFGVKVKGDKVTDYYTLDGFDGRKDTSLSKNTQYFPIVNADGSVSRGSNRDEISVRSSTIGGEFHYAFNNRLILDDRLAYTWNNGTFSVPFYGSFTTVGALTSGANPYRVTANGQTYTATTAVLANGPNAGATLDPSTIVNGNPTLNTKMRNMNHFGNDLGVTAKVPVWRGQLAIRGGYYHYDQTIDMDWHWNSSFQQATSNDPAFIDLFAQDGTRLTDGGIAGYNGGFGRVTRVYRLNFHGNAPNASLNYNDNHIDLDASARYEIFHADGLYRDTAPGTSRVDVNGDGVYSVAESNVFLPVSAAQGQRVDYTVRYWNWSFGANYRFNANTALFARASKGNRAGADRLPNANPLPFSATNPLNPDGSLTAIGRGQAVNPVTQQEAGIKQRGNLSGLSYGLFLTGFRSQATEYTTDIDARGVSLINQRYHTYGAELESQFSYDHLALNTNIVYTHSRITSGALDGNTPRATPYWTFVVSPSYNIKWGSVGFTYLGQTASYPYDTNLLKQRGQGIFNLFASVHPIEKATVSVNVANLFNSWDQSGRLDQDSVAALQSTGAIFGVPYAGSNRVGLGRTVSVSATYDF